jgi:hypothetical protein
MFITSIQVRGFRDLASFSATGLGRVVHVLGPTPQTTALADAVQLTFAAVSQDLLADLIGRWQLCGPEEQPEIVGEPFPDQASWTDTSAAGAIVGPERNLRVELSMRLDPPLYGSLRQQAAREPRLVAALSSGAELRLSVGALFTRSWDTMALTIHSVAFGDVALTDQDRKRWGNRFLRQLGERLHRFVPSAAVGDIAMAALTSRDQRGAYESWAVALLPDGPSLRVISGPGGRSQVLANERPLARWGWQVQEQAALAAAIHLSGADIVWAETEEPEVAAAVEGDASPLEQVFVVSSAGTLEVEDAPTKTLSTTSLPTNLYPTTAT